MINVYFLNLSKRKNSTLRPTITESTPVTECLLKDNCDQDNPTFLINANTFNFNYAVWEDHYYFINSITYVKNNLFEVSCVLDVLATYKTAILSTTAYVTYSNISGGSWLPDTRIPVLKDTVVSSNSVLPDFYKTGGAGHYILTVIGKEGGCVSYSCTESQIKLLINNLQSQIDAQYNSLISGMAFATPEQAIESFSKMAVKSDIIGNAYSNAPSCIRQCIYVPFKTEGAVYDAQPVYLGNFITPITAPPIKTNPQTGSSTVNIPWHYSDWRRATAENIYLYLPLVGMIGLSTDSITKESSITVNWSYTLNDGNIAYQIVAGDQVIGSYGGSCVTQYPIGINQTASLGEVANTLISGIEKTTAAAVSSGINVAGFATETAVGMVKTGYDVINVANSTHPTCIGGIGGGAGNGLDHNIICYSVAHPTVIEPSAMSLTMGVPTMKPMLLSSCSGFCQCANAHVSAVAHSDNLNEIDAYINSGFYIE